MRSKIARPIVIANLSIDKNLAVSLTILLATIHEVTK
jgi:hypothetical protein